MAIRLDYETKAGAFSRADTEMQLMEHLRLAAECCYMIGHDMKADGDELRGQGFLAMGQMFERNVLTIINGLARMTK